MTKEDREQICDHLAGFFSNDENLSESEEILEDLGLS